MSIDEVDLKQERNYIFLKQISHLKKIFLKRRINVYGCNGKKEVYQAINTIIHNHKIKSVGFSDSVTLHQLDIFNFLKFDYKIINPFERYEDGKLKIFGKLPPGKLDLPYDEYYTLVEKLINKMRETLLTDLFVIGANAITMNGEIVSIDGSGNRVAGMIFGPKKVIIIVGKNKIVKDLDQALYRIKNIAAPLNYIRHINKHHNRFDELPCVKLGYCVDCNHPRSACYNTVIVRGAVEINKDRIHLIIVNENLGF